MPLHWLILITLLTLLLLSMIYKRSALKRVRYARTFDKRAVFAGETVQMVETIANDKLLPLPWIRLESMMQSGLHFDRQENLDIHRGDRLQNHKSLFSLLPYRQIVRRHRVRCAKRGVYRLDSATMTAGDPFGLAEAVQTVKLSLELVVYPEPVLLDAIPFSNRGWMGELTVRRWTMEDPFLTSGVRDYVPGDSLRSIHWQATARAGTLQVRQNDYTSERKLTLLVNFETTERMWNQVTKPELVEYLLGCAAAVADYIVSQGMEVGFCCNGRLPSDPHRTVSIPEGGGLAHLTHLLDTMARLEMRIASNFHTLLEREIERDAEQVDYLVLTATMSEETELRLERLRARGHHVETVKL